jgi:hypothetical protein
LGTQFLKNLAGIVLADDRPGAPEINLFWASNLEEAGQALHGYQSARLPASLLEKDNQEKLADALFAAAQHWGVSLHVNKGLAGAPTQVIEAARDTAMNPAVLDAFALLISGAEGPPAHPGIRGHEPDLVAARHPASKKFPSATYEPACPRCCRARGSSANSKKHALFLEIKNHQITATRGNLSWAMRCRSFA